VNGQGRVTFNLQQSRDPVTTIIVLLNDVPQYDPLSGYDLRQVAGAYFTLPRLPGSYKLSVIASTAAGCVDDAGGAVHPERAMTVFVQ
jgi:hypothetical protein